MRYWRKLNRMIETKIQHLSVWFHPILTFNIHSCMFSLSFFMGSDMVNRMIKGQKGDIWEKTKQHA